jgi:hypothetical protein
LVAANATFIASGKTAKISVVLIGFCMLSLSSCNDEPNAPDQLGTQIQSVRLRALPRQFFDSHQLFLSSAAKTEKTS